MLWGEQRFRMTQIGEIGYFRTMRFGKLMQPRRCCSCSSPVDEGTIPRRDKLEQIDEDSVFSSIECPALFVSFRERSAYYCV